MNNPRLFFVLLVVVLFLSACTSTPTTTPTLSFTPTSTATNTPIPSLTPTSTPIPTPTEPVIIWDGKTEAEIKEIAKGLVDEYLLSFYSEDTDNCYRLEDHEINDFYFHTVRDDNVVVMTVSYSVKPIIERSCWIAGNGTDSEDGEWIINKSQCTYLSKEDSIYVLKMGG